MDTSESPGTAVRPEGAGGGVWSYGVALTTAVKGLLLVS